MSDSIWRRTLAEQQRLELDRSDAPPVTAEVVVVGGGLIGLATAYYLAEAGVSDLCVIDRAGPAAEASGANAGGLWVAQQSASLGPVAPLGRLSYRLFEELAERFDFDYHLCGLLELFYDESGHDAARDQAQAIAHAGFPVELLDAAGLRRVEPNLAGEAAGGLLSPSDGQIHPVKLAAELIRTLREKNVRVCSGVEALRLGAPIETSAGPIDAEVTVVTAGAWTPLLTQTFGWTPPIRPIRGTLLALPAQPAETIRQIVMGERFYFWQLAAGPVACGGSEDDLGFERGVEAATVEAIRADLARYFPRLGSEPTVCAWSGFRPLCEDGKPVIGRAPGREDLFVAAGHFKKGVMLAPGTGRVLTDLILGREPETDIAALDPARFALEAA